jgi:IS605 OrfB family transposase
MESYRAAVNFYIRSLWYERGKLDKSTLARLPSNHTRLSERYKSQALKQAIETVVATRLAAKATKKWASMPVFRGAATLDAKFVTIEDGHGSFDLVVRLSTLRKGHRITIPTRRTAPLNKWLGKPGAVLIQGCSLSEHRLVVWVEVPTQEPRKTGKQLGLDIGINKLVVDSNGNRYGVDFKSVRDKINRRKPGSNGRRRAFRERDNLIGRELNMLPWNRLSVVGCEDLHDMKRGKRKGRDKSFRKAVAPWTYRQVLNRIRDKAQENRVRFVLVPPANTSRTCPNCGTVSADSRRGEDFICVACGYRADADHVGAQNVLARTRLLLGSVESPRLVRAM